MQIFFDLYPILTLKYIDTRTTEHKAIWKIVYDELKRQYKKDANTDDERQQKKTTNNNKKEVNKLEKRQNKSI